MFSFATLLIILVLPSSCTVFLWNQNRVDVGILFPVMLASWFAAVFAVAYNNLFMDELCLHGAHIEMARRKKYLPTLLSIPGFLSFLWFCYRWYMGKPVD
jgi:hypothetical protein